jgi:hypothetical protein
MVRNTSLSAFIEVDKRAALAFGYKKLRQSKSGQNFERYAGRQASRSAASIRSKGRRLFGTKTKAKSKTAGKSSEITASDFRLPSSRQLDGEMFCSPETMVNGETRSQLFKIICELITPKGSTQPSPAGMRTQKGKLAPSKWNGVLPLGVTRKFTFTYGSSMKAMPSSSIASPFKFTAYTSDSVVSTGWRKSNAHRQQNIGLNEKLVKVFPTELGEIAMRRMSAMTGGRKYNDYKADARIQAMWDSPAEDAGGNEYRGMTRSRYFPIVVSK